MIQQLPALQDDGPSSDYYGRFSNRERGVRNISSRDRRGSRTPRGRGGFDDDDEDLFRRGGRSFKTENSWSRNSRGSGNDWLIGSNRRPSRSSSSSSFGNRERYLFFCSFLDHLLNYSGIWLASYIFNIQGVLSMSACQCLKISANFKELATQDW